MHSRRFGLCSVYLHLMHGQNIVTQVIRFCVLRTAGPVIVRCVNLVGIVQGGIYRKIIVQVTIHVLKTGHFLIMGHPILINVFQSSVVFRENFCQKTPVLVLHVPVVIIVRGGHLVLTNIMTRALLNVHLQHLFHPLRAVMNQLVRQLLLAQLGIIYLLGPVTVPLGVG